MHRPVLATTPLPCIPGSGHFDECAVYISIALSLIAAAASLLRGQKYIHGVGATGTVTNAPAGPAAGGAPLSAETLGAILGVLLLAHSQLQLQGAAAGGEASAESDAQGAGRVARDRMTAMLEVVGVGLLQDYVRHRKAAGPATDDDHRPVPVSKPS